MLRQDIKELPCQVTRAMTETRAPAPVSAGEENPAPRDGWGSEGFLKKRDLHGEFRTPRVR